MVRVLKLTKGSSTAMGMAASQARFLGLTARKNNVEFEGQQINQQRTALSNQSANYYNDLLGMSVPVPPSVDDYTKTVYTFEDGALTNQITAMMAQNDGTYTVSYLRQWTDDFSVVSATTSIINASKDANNNDVYKVGSNQLRDMSDGLNGLEGLAYDNYYQLNGQRLEAGTTQNGVTPYTYDKDGTTETVYLKDNKWYSDANATTELNEQVLSKTDVVGKYEGDDEYIKTLSNDQIKQLLKEEESYIELLKNKYGADSEYMVRYVKNSTTGEYNPYFYKLADLEKANYDDNGNSLSNINCYKVGSETKTEEVKAQKGCQIEKDSSGRYINITIPDESGSRVTYALTTSTATDQDAYEDAMNQYEYEKYEYDQAIEEINAKIEIVQSQDKNLELRLKQLDTEHNAVQTEIDAVQKVIEKNTESSFKTFG